MPIFSLVLDLVLCCGIKPFDSKRNDELHVSMPLNRACDAQSMTGMSFSDAGLFFFFPSQGH